jgi:hypothetical protein
MIPNEVIFARDKLVGIVEETFNIEATDLILKQRGRGRKLGISNRKTHIVYLCIIWLIENKKVSRNIAAQCFNRDHCVASNAIKVCKELIESRDIEFDHILYEFNIALNQRGIREVTLEESRLNNVIKKLTKNEVYHIKFMLENNIDIELIANHFKINENSIINIKNELNDSK